jgi:hypothetical protein
LRTPETCMRTATHVRQDPITPNLSSNWNIGCGPPEGWIARMRRESRPDIERDRALSMMTLNSKVPFNSCALGRGVPHGNRLTATAK